MHVFILTDTIWLPSKVVLYQKVWDFVEGGALMDDVQFYIIDKALPGEYVALIQRHASMHACYNIHVINQDEALILMGQVTNGVLVHFGSLLKGIPTYLPTYFIPLSHPNCATDLSMIQKWIQKKAFKQQLLKATNTLCLNEWTLNCFNSWNRKESVHFKSAYLPTITLPTYEWQTLAATKEAIAGGNNYYLAFVPVNEMIATLKEFSIFKKWQQTTMSLVFIFDTASQCNQAEQLLKGYKYKESIFIQTISKLKMEWLAASYTIIWSGVAFDKTYLMEWAVLYDIPLLFNKHIHQPTSWLEAGEVFDFSATMALSNHFKLYYKDELYRQSRASIGRAWIANLYADTALNVPMKLPSSLYIIN